MNCIVPKLLACSLAFLLVSCSATTDIRLQVMAVEYQQTCFGSTTVDCVTLRAKHNVLALTGAIVSIKGQKVEMLKVLTAAEYAAGLSVLAHMRDQNEADRPNVLSRIFMGSREIAFNVGSRNYLLSQSAAEQAFAAAVLRVRESNTPEKESQSEPAPVEAQAAEAQTNAPPSPSVAAKAADTFALPPTQAFRQADSAATGVAGYLPSFDCRQATQAAEHLICGSNELAAADVAVAAAYSAAIKCSQDKLALRKDQRAWMAARNVCPNSSCMDVAYGKRLGELQNHCSS